MYDITSYLDDIIAAKNERFTSQYKAIGKIPPTKATLQGNTKPTTLQLMSTIAPNDLPNVCPI